MKLLKFIKCLFGFGSTVDGSVCRFSKKYWDIHDYPIDLGGDGVPSHFYEYTCSNCGKAFRI